MIIVTAYFLQLAFGDAPFIIPMYNEYIMFYIQYVMYTLSTLSDFNKRDNTLMTNMHYHADPPMN